MYTKKVGPDYLFEAVDNSPLIIFRMIFGFLIIAESWGAIMTGWVDEVFIDTSFNFSFIGFEWLSILHGEQMYYYFFIMGVVGTMIMTGLYYRISIMAFMLMWSAVYLAQKSHYNNHYYLLMLLSIVMAAVPANACKSVDIIRNKSLRSTTCPRWCLWLFAAQVSLVYFYGGLAKIYPDWIAARPISIWFQAKDHYFLIGPLLGKEWFQFFISYAGILFDILIAPALIWKKTRKWAFIATIAFHLFNSAVFQVGIFPYIGIAFGIFFFAPSVIGRIFFKRKPEQLSTRTYKTNRWVLAGLCVWFTIQIALPLRHWLYPGNVHWTEEGHRLSWHMMLRVKYGHVAFRVVDTDTGEEWVVKPQEFVTRNQAADVATKPDVCWQFVQRLKSHYKTKGINNLEVYAEGRANLNGNGYSNLYDPKVNLAKVDWKAFSHADWLLPYPYR